MADALHAFYDRIPLIDRFETVGDTARYVSLPDGWHVGVADVEDSTRAIAAGQYKAVNMVGAAVIAATMNALKTRNYPFAFGGDGAAIAVPPDAAAAAADALARVRRFAATALDLELRVGLVPVEDIRAAGHDVRVARFGVSPKLSFALFSGGGVHWAEQALKAGRIALPEAPQDAWPDLAGLSCRWEPFASRNGRIVSLIAVPAPGADEADFAALVTRISEIADAAPDRAVPVSAESMVPTVFSSGLAIEARAARGAVGRTLTYLKLVAVSVFGWVLFRNHWRFGGFDPDAYRAMSVLNSDFRKFDDGLRMTLDCNAEVEAGIRRALEAAQADGIADYGIHTQDAALMTCLVPSVMSDDHMHFIDGAAGGYAQAAVALKGRIAARAAAA
ncbi:DUF3095 domain-containing protein [Microbaculum marinisediminis]|uniref:DUF3095 domain-containing protein n=1 Tax=Microbaculum marinisediminis TaxID=2931392 RepID=A0AAW5R7A3_9HYPH|nr:DUF3095 domain-containing protein [Microbaculum sp. A6E488]MCT8974828.1 DUF3095 domain-containing protein [Microbaculum sp. A6E488]